MSMLDAQRRVTKQALFCAKRLGEPILYTGADDIQKETENVEELSVTKNQKEVAPVETPKTNESIWFNRKFTFNDTGDEDVKG